MNVIFSVLLLLLGSVGPMYAKTSPYSQMSDEQVKMFAHNSLSKAIPLAKEEYKRAAAQAFIKGGDGGVLADLIFAYTDNVVNFLVDVAQDMYREEALIFWIEVEPYIIQSLDMFPLCRDPVFKGYATQDVSYTIGYQKALL